MIRIIAISLCLFEFSCFNTSNANFEFVNRFGSENFAEFRDVTIFIRGSDNAGNKIIFAYDDSLLANLNNGPYIITISQNLNHVISNDCHLMKDSANINKLKLQKLALRFVQYPIAYISVDSSYNVSINLNMNERPNLIRFASSNQKTQQFNAWTKLKNNWYEYSGN